MKKIIIIMLCFLLMSCSNNDLIKNDNSLSFDDNKEDNSYLTITFDENDELENIYLVYEFDTEEIAEKAVEAFENSELKVELNRVGKNVAILYTDDSFDNYAGMSKEEVKKELLEEKYELLD